MRLQLARLQGGLIHGLQCRPDLGYEMNDIKRLKIPYDIPPNMHYSKIKFWRSFLISSLSSSHQFGHLYQHLFLCSFILNHTSRLSSCKILLFFGCILKFPTWQSFSFLLLLLFGPNFCLDCPFEFLAQQAFYFFIFWPQLLPRPPFQVFSLAGFFSFLGL